MPMDNVPAMESILLLMVLNTLVSTVMEISRDEVATRCLVVKSMMETGCKIDAMDKAYVIGPMVTCMKESGLMTFPRVWAA